MQCVCLQDLPPLKELHITVKEDVVMTEVGVVSGIVDLLGMCRAVKEQAAIICICPIFESNSLRSYVNYRFVHDNVTDPLKPI